MIAFARGLFGAELFDDPESLDAMTTPAPGSSYGLGITVGADDMGHAGYIAGFRTLLNYVPASDTVVVLLYNNDAADPEQALPTVLDPALQFLRAEN